jgi:hypothetical protein
MRNFMESPQGPAHTFAPGIADFVRKRPIHAVAALCDAAAVYRAAQNGPWHSSEASGGAGRVQLRDPDRLRDSFREILMTRRSWLLVSIPGVFFAGYVLAQQFPIMDKVADKVIQKYQTSSCEQLWQERAQGKSQPKPEMEQRAIGMLKSDPQMRQAFFNKVAAPIVNKMFECGMIP